MIQIKSTHKLSVPASELTVQVLNQFLNPLEDETIIRVTKDSPNRPGERPMIYLEADVDLERDGRGLTIHNYQGVPTHE